MKRVKQKSKVEVQDDSEINQLKEKINTAHQGVIDGYKKAIEHALRCGALLEQAKDIVGWGNFGQWIHNNCKFSVHTATLYLRLSRRLVDAPQLKSKVLLMNLNEADNYLRRHHVVQINKTKLNPVKLAEQLSEHFVALHELALLIKKHMDDDDWKHWKNNEVGRLLHDFVDFERTVNDRDLPHNLNKEDEFDENDARAVEDRFLPEHDPRDGFFSNEKERAPTLRESETGEGGKLIP